MKKLILKRIDELKEINDNFAVGYLKNLKINNVHISEVDFSKLNVELLISVFEIIVRKSNRVC